MKQGRVAKTRLLLFGGGVMRGRQGVGFALVCLLAGSRWLVDNEYPSALPPLLEQALAFFIVGLAALLFSWRRRQPLSAVSARTGLAGVMLFAVPAFVGAWAGSQAGPALFTLVPLWVVVGVAAFSPRQESRRLLMPALVGATGGLLVLPFALPNAISGTVRMAMVLATVAMIAAGSVWLHNLLQGAPLAAAVSWLGGVNAIVLGAAGLTFENPAAFGGQWGGEILRVTIFDLPQVFLLLWLLREMKPEQAAARFIAIPLLTVVEGLMLVRVEVSVRAGVGLVLMAAGSGALLLWKSYGQEDRASPLGLSG